MGHRSSITVKGRTQNFIEFSAQGSSIFNLFWGVKSAGDTPYRLFALKYLIQIDIMLAPAWHVALHRSFVINSFLPFWPCSIAIF